LLPFLLGSSAHTHRGLAFPPFQVSIPKMTGEVEDKVIVEEEEEVGDEVN
jgi:hypothetical protein